MTTAPPDIFIFASSFRGLALSVGGGEWEAGKLSCFVEVFFYSYVI